MVDLSLVSMPPTMVAMPVAAAVTLFGKASTIEIGFATLIVSSVDLWLSTSAAKPMSGRFFLIATDVMSGTPDRFDLFVGDVTAIGMTPFTDGATDAVGLPLLSAVLHGHFRCWGPVTLIGLTV